MNNKSSWTRGGNIAKGERGGGGEEFLRVSKSHGCQKRRRGVLRREVFNDHAAY